MLLNFIKMNPAGNTTIFILDQLPKNIHGKVSNYLMEPICLCADQVGFIEKSYSRKAVLRLQMMGGEFCGNALRSFAALLYLRGYPGIKTKHKSITETISHNGIKNYSIIPIEISGYDGILEVKVVEVDPIHGVYWSSTPIPAPIKIIEDNFYLNCLDIIKKGIVVKFPGITHIIFNDIIPKKEIIFEVQKKIESLTINNDTIGIMFYNPQNETLVPLVYVKNSDSIVWEGSCGSGSAAVAAAMAMENSTSVKNLKLKQPGGEIEVDVDYFANKVDNCIIKGNVSFVCEGKVLIADI